MNMLEDDQKHIYDFTTEVPLIKHCFSSDWKQRSSN